MEIQLSRRVIGQHPRKHRVLRDVVVRAPGDYVEFHYILEVRYLSPSPLLCEFRCLQHLCTSGAYGMNGLFEVHVNGSFTCIRHCAMLEETATQYSLLYLYSYSLFSDEEGRVAC